MTNRKYKCAICAKVSMEKTSPYSWVQMLDSTASAEKENSKLVVYCGFSLQKPPSPPLNLPGRVYLCVQSGTPGDGLSRTPGTGRQLFQDCSSVACTWQTASPAHSHMTINYTYSHITSALPDQNTTTQGPYDLQISTDKILFIKYPIYAHLFLHVYKLRRETTQQPLSKHDASYY